MLRSRSIMVALRVVILLTLQSSLSFGMAFSVPKNIVVVGGGIQGTSVAYNLAKQSSATTTITLLESKEPAAAASGKGGGFMARSWGNGSPTQKLHELAFDLYPTICQEIGCKSYRKLPVLSVTPGYKGVKEARKKYGTIMPDWLDGEVGRISPMGMGDDTAQVTPHEFVHKMLEASGERINVVLGTCCGVETTQGSGINRKLTAVKYRPRDSTGDEEVSLPADALVISAGPWSCAAEDWFQGAVELPMEGIKSTSIVWKKPDDLEEVDATALFCGEDDRYGTHLEVYPRPDGTIYLCGIGGSDYISKDELKAGAFRQECNANESRVRAATEAFQSMSSAYRTNGQLDRTQACMRPCPPDAMPYMGKIPGFDGAYLNAGHNCWGIAWAPACGVAMTELVLTGECQSVNLKPFDPSRFTPKVHGRGRKKQGTDVGEQW